MPVPIKLVLTTTGSFATLLEDHSPVTLRILCPDSGSREVRRLNLRCTIYGVYFIYQSGHQMRIRILLASVLVPILTWLTIQTINAQQQQQRTPLDAKLHELLTGKRDALRERFDFIKA